MEMLETINGLARKHGVQRRMMRQALAEAAPPERKKAARQEPVLGPRKAILDGILERDRQAPRKQRHTAHRIWTRLRPGYSAHAVGEPTVRGYDRVSMPRSYGLGQEAQVDWCEAQAEPDGQAHQARNLEMFEIVKEVILYQRLELFCRNTPDLSHRENACACVNL